MAAPPRDPYHPAPAHSVVSASTVRRMQGVAPQDIKQTLRGRQMALQLPQWPVWHPKDALAFMAFRPPPMDLQVLVAGPMEGVATALWLAPDEALSPRGGAQPRGCGGQCPWTMLRASWTVRDVADVPLAGSAPRRMHPNVQPGMCVSMAPVISGGRVKPQVLVSTHTLREVVGLVRIIAVAFADSVPP